MLADARSSAHLASIPNAKMPADARAPTLPAFAPLSLVWADARAPAPLSTLLALVPAEPPPGEIAPLIGDLFFSAPRSASRQRDWSRQQHRYASKTGTYGGRRVRRPNQHLGGSAARRTLRTFARPPLPPAVCAATAGPRHALLCCDRGRDERQTGNRVPALGRRGLEVEGMC